MPITKNGSGEIILTPASDRFQTNLTGVHPADSFQVCDNTDQLKQVSYDLAAMAAASRVKLKFANADPDSEIEITFPSTTSTLGFVGGEPASFSIIQPDSGTSPTAESQSDTLSLTSANTLLSVSGDSATDTITFTVNRASFLPVTTKTGDYVAASTDGTILVDASGGAVAITLPTAVGHSGLYLNIKLISSGANGVTVNTTSSQTIDGETSLYLALQYECVSIQSNGTNWYII